MPAPSPNTRFAIYVVPGVLIGFILSLALAYGLLFFYKDGEIPKSQRFTKNETATSVLYTITPSSLKNTPDTTARAAASSASPSIESSFPPRPDNFDFSLAGPPIQYPGVDPLDIESRYIVPAMPPVDDSYFSDAVFIGNSIVGLQMLTGSIREATYYTRHSLQVESYFTQPIRIQDGVETPIPEALSQHKFKKVYLMLGVNEMSWPHFDELSNLFDMVIKNIVETQPDAIIYIQSVLPVEGSLDGQTINGQEVVPNNRLVQKMNREILAICERNNVWFLNSAEALYDANGVLPANSTNDGTHFGSDITKLWDDYLRTHAIPVAKVEAKP